MASYVGQLLALAENSSFWSWNIWRKIIRALDWNQSFCSGGGWGLLSKATQGIIQACTLLSSLIKSVMVYVQQGFWSVQPGFFVGNIALADSLSVWRILHLRQPCFRLSGDVGSWWWGWGWRGAVVARDHSRFPCTAERQASRQTWTGPRHIASIANRHVQINILIGFSKYTPSSKRKG